MWKIHGLLDVGGGRLSNLADEDCVSTSWEGKRNGGAAHERLIDFGGARQVDAWTLAASNASKLDAAT